MPIRLMALVLLFAAAVSSCGRSVRSAGGDDSGIDEVFERVATETDWDLSGALVWGHYFYHHEKAPLESFRDSLTALGYQAVSLEPAPPAAPNETETKPGQKEKPVPTVWRLHVEKTEIHSAASMKRRGAELAALAADAGIDGYDGMDVAPAPNSAIGHEHGWWVYLSDFEGSPGSVSLNLALKPAAPFPRFEWLIITGSRFDSGQQSKGLPSDEQLAEIQRLRKQRISLIKQAVPAIEAGGLLLDGEEFHYIYVTETAGIEDQLRQFYEQRKTEFDPLIQIEKNPDWSVFFDTLFPSPAIIRQYEKELRAEGFWELVNVPRRENAR